MALAWSANPKVSIEITFDLKNSALEEKGIFSVKAFQPQAAFTLDALTNPPSELYTSPYPAWVNDVENCIVWAGLALNRPEIVNLKPDYKKGSLTFSTILPLEVETLHFTGGDLVAASKRINTDIPDYFA